jgi:hydrogenase small subunit
MTSTPDWTSDLDLSSLGVIGATQTRQHRNIERREFLKIITAAAASVGIAGSVAVEMAEAALKGLKPSVIWLHFQECTGCTESLLRTSHPDLAEVILDLVSLDYHETLFAAAGHQIEDALHKVMEERKGEYICVVEGSIPTRDGGIYCKIAGKTAMQLVDEVAAGAAAVIAIGSCASWGGIPSAAPNPTGARGAPEVLAMTNRQVPIVTIPGCPANPYNFLGVVLQFVTMGTLPALDDKLRPMFAYGRTIHEHCPRRAHFDAGRFALKYGDAGHREGYCLYRLGCKGPSTYANCSVQHFNEIPDAWPIGIGHPCFGCTEQALAFNAPLHSTVEIERPTPPDTYPPVQGEPGAVSAVASGLAGAIVGAIAGGAMVASRKLEVGEDDHPAPGKSSDRKEH